MKIAIIGGHFSPALSVIQELKNHEVFYIGRKYVFEGDNTPSYEFNEISKMGIPFYPINTARLQRRFTKHTISSFLKFPLGLYESLRVLRKIKPDVVVGFGGYVQVPVNMAARVLKIPVIIHEQTLEAGLANRFSAKFAKKILISWESSYPFFPKHKTLLTGNPIKQEIISAKQNQKIKSGNKTIFVTGGTSGSHFINSIIGKNLKKILEDYYLIHQTGDSKTFNDFSVLSDIKNALPEKLSKKYQIHKYLSAKESAKYMRNAELVIGRSGMNTVTDLIYLNTPSLFIPLSIAGKNEQLKNAQFAKKLGLAEIIKEDEITDDILLAKIHEMKSSIDKYKVVLNVLVENAPQNIVREIENVSAKKTA